MLGGQRFVAMSHPDLLQQCNILVAELLAKENELEAVRAAAGNSR